VQEVAIDLHLSPRRLRQLCTGWFGFPPKVILEVTACDSIAQELLETDSPLNEIALRQGFREPAAFNRFFKRVTGESPGRYRTSRRPGLD
jgi:AraC-like DNA-binding protein